MKEVTITGYFTVNGARINGMRYKSALEWTKVQLMDAPYTGFCEADIYTNEDGTYLGVSGSRKDFTEFDDVPRVDMEIQYKFQSMDCTFAYKVTGEKPYMAATWIMEALYHPFLSTGQFSELKMDVTGYEVGG